MPHRIRLRSPWDCEPLTRCFTRCFHKPTGLTATTRVWLVIDQATCDARIDLNNKAIGKAFTGHAARFDITADLQPTNLLAITLTDPQSDIKIPPTGPIGLVALEIE